MLFSSSTTRRLGTLATACLLGVALTATPALAQKTKTKPAPQAQADIAPASTTIDVTIPSIDAVDSNVDEATLRAILAGNLVDNAEALAGLTATSITIPQLVLEASNRRTGQTIHSSVTIRDIVLDQVVDGVAKSFSIAGTSIASKSQFEAEFGAVSASNMDIGGLLRLYGLVEGNGQTEMTTIYNDVSFAGGTITSPELNCTIGEMTAAEFKARPLNASFAEIMALSTAMSASDDAPSPELLGKMLHFYADMFSAFESSPVTFDGIDCSGTNDGGEVVDFSVASMSMAGMSPGTYPAIDMSGIKIAVEGDGMISIGNVGFKQIDLSAPIAAIAAAPATIDEVWLGANGRSLIPAFAGFSVDDIAIDIPDPDNIGDRLIVNVGAFDLSLDNYRNGIPTALATSARNIAVALPENSTDEQLQLLRSIGVTDIDGGFTIDANWDEADNTIAVNEVSLTGVDLGTVKLAATIGNATEALFADNETMMMAAAMGLALQDVKLDIADAGLADIIMTLVAADQGSDAATMRPVFAGLAEGTVIGVLAGADGAQKVGSAISAFVAGTSKTLTINVTARKAPGLGMLDFMAAEDDPTSLLSKVEIKASN
tara:strand:+ start:886 stop:2688 length:1803 start_codon:yes stop_codon:yes gene_type:complete